MGIQTQIDVRVIARDGKYLGEYYSAELPLKFDENAPDGIPSQFSNKWQVPKNETGQPEIYEIIVSAFQQKTGNTGVDKATAIIPSESPDAQS